MGADAVRTTVSDPASGAALGVGDRVVVDVGAVAHGGHCVARHAGHVLFVRHALPGERVEARITAVGRRGRFLRADAVEVLRPAPDRREPPCPAALTCGGCDWQHVGPAGSRALKADVVREALQRFAGVRLPEGFAVAEVPWPAWAPTPVTTSEGLGWRTRADLSVDAQGRAGLRPGRSHEVVALTACPQLDGRLGALDVFGRSWPPGSRIRVVAPAVGEPLLLEGPTDLTVTERAAGREWLVAADGFWQVHPGAADALVDAVRRLAGVRPGDRVVDLYSGVGLLGLSVARSDGPLGGLVLVEGDRRACELARLNAADVAASVVRASVDRWVGRRGALAGVDVVLLDPPRSGAGAAVVEALATSGARSVVYVACDPVALARDVATFQDRGHRLAALEAFDLFPTTHHVECVARLEPIS